MNNDFFNKRIIEIYNRFNKDIDYFYTEISNEYLNEYTNIYNNYIVYLTGFTGETASLLCSKNEKYLFVDGRFTIQAKNEVFSDVKVIEIGKNNSIYDEIKKIIKKGKVVLINPKIHSIKRVKELVKVFDDKFVKIIFDTDLNKQENTNIDLRLIDKKYLDDNTIKNIIQFKKNIIKHYTESFVYITSDLLEIISFLNIRNMSYENFDLTFDAFLIITNRDVIIYTDCVLDKDILNYLEKNNVKNKSFDEFYKDLKNIIFVFYSINVIIDFSRNNYYIYNILKQNPHLKIHNDEINKIFYLIFNQKTNTQIRNLEICGILDGVFITKIIYLIKNIDFDKNEFTEYDIKNFIDNAKRDKDYLTTSFDTIVAYKENSAICHYLPNKKNAKKIRNDSVLLIDTGAHYLYGTTDITRVISLYKKNIPKDLKRHYTLVLKSLLKMMFQIVKSDYDIGQIDIIARQELFNNLLDFNHGTSHGIGYLSNVHFGSNNYSGKNNLVKIMPNQVQSLEPGLYFENRYGIRIENDTYVYSVKKNKYGEFLGFKNLTWCPFDMELIDYNLLNSDDIIRLNNYNKKLYDKISKYLPEPVKKWLYNQTKKI